MNLRHLTNNLRFAACISAVFLGLGGVSARAAGSATVNLSGAAFGKGLEVHLNSGTTLLPAAKAYEYSISGTIHGTGALAVVLPNGTQLSTLLDTIQPGSSSFLNGTQPNPNGTLPFQVINRTFSGSVPIPGFPVSASASVKIVGKVTASGQVRFDVTNVDFSIPGFPLDLGTVVFETGSKLVVNAPALIGFKTASVKVVENVGTLTVTVKRRVNSSGAVSVHYASIPGTATESDYTPVSGDINFADGETTKTFGVAITNRAGAQGARIFTLKLSAPTGGAFLGVIRKEVVKIIDAP